MEERRYIHLVTLAGGRWGRGDGLPDVWREATCHEVPEEKPAPLSVADVLSAGLFQGEDYPTLTGVKSPLRRFLEGCDVVFCLCGGEGGERPFPCFRTHPTCYPDGREGVTDHPLPFPGMKAHPGGWRSRAQGWPCSVCGRGGMRERFWQAVGGTWRG